MSHSKRKLKHFKNELLNIKGTYYIDEDFYFRINDVPYDILANVQQVVKIVDDREAELIPIMVLEIPSKINNFEYVGYTIEDAKRSKIKKGYIMGFKQENIYRFTETYIDYTKEITVSYLSFIMNTRK